MLTKKLVAASVAMTAFTAVASDDMKAQLEELKNAYVKQQQEMQSMRQQIKDVESVHSEAIHKYIKDEIKSEVSKQSSLLILNKHVTNLKIKGDLRLRYQREDKSAYDKVTGERTGKETRDRFRQRVRVGAEWKTTEGWTIGLGVATGDEDGSSTNDTYGDEGVWDTGDLRLDYAFAKHSWDLGQDGTQTLILGKMKNPFYTSKAFFDGDYRPTGVAYQIETGSGIFATVGGFTVEQNNDGKDENDTTMYAAQVGYANDLFKAAVAYYYYNNTDGSVAADDFDTTDHTVELMDAIAEVYLKAGDFKITPYAQFAINNEADDEDTAYMIGTKAKIGNFSFGYEYRHMEENAVPSVIMDSDFTGGANYEGSVLSAKYAFSKNMTLGGKAYLTEEINDSGKDDTDRHLYQLDLVYKF